MVARRRTAARRLVGLAAVLACVAPPAMPALASPPVPTGLAVGGNHSCAFHLAALICWGYDGNGAVGGGLAGLDMPPVTVDTSGALSGVTLTQVTAGRDHTCALSATGRAYCWGDNTFGQLGNGDPGTGQVTPVPVGQGGVTFTAISAGGDHTCGLTGAGAAYCWGANDSGQLGDGSTSERDVPTVVSLGVALTAIGTGDDHTCGLTATGAAYCWGGNDSGQLGDGSTSQRSLPVLVSLAGGVVLTAISAGGDHTCGLTAVGGAYCWGANDSGQLGDGTTSQRTVPVLVSTGAAFTAVSAGEDHTCALTFAGAAYCWGANDRGQVGDGTANDRHAPVAVPLPGVTLHAIATGTAHSCGLSTLDRTYCWGWNADQQLGDGTGADQSTPVAVRPGPPIGVAGTAGDHSVEVTWVAPLGLYGGALTGYTATANPGGRACTTTGATDCVISGLDNGTPYLVSVVAQTTAGDSVPVSSTEPATPFTPPDPPTAVAATAGDGEIFVSWTAPASLGSGTLTGYTATSDPDGAQCSSTVDTQCVITGLDNGVEYTVTVVTHSTVGDSFDSDPSNPVTPNLPAVVLPPVLPAANGAMQSSAGTYFTEASRDTTLTGTGFDPGTGVLIGIYSSPQRLASATADRSGRFSARITIPDGYSGSHTLVAVGLAPTHRQRALLLRIRVAAPTTLADTGTALIIALLVIGTGLMVAGAVGFLSLRARRAAA